MELISKLERGIEDIDFDKLYPEYIGNLSKIHWTPIEIITIAIDWLVNSTSTKVLDIGSGVGKFCIVGAALSKAKFTGVEKRKNLFKEANKALNKLSIKGVNFIHTNITEISFAHFDAFYYFNPFCEQIASVGWIDHNISFSSSKYQLYEEYVYNQLSKMPIGTKIVTYCSQSFSPPDTYTIQNIMFDGQLVLWVKQKRVE